MEKFKITFYPDNKAIEVEKGKTILSAAISAGIHINSSCGGDGVCGRCKVILKNGQLASLPTGRLTADEKKKGYYLSCLSVAQSNLEVEIPRESRLDSETIAKDDVYLLRLKGVYSESEDIDKGESILGEEIFIHSPLATKFFLDLPKPNLEDKLSDLERIYRAVRSHQAISVLQTGIANIRRLGALLHSSDWKVTVMLGKRNGTTEIVLIEPGDTSSQNYGFAFDIGTTTICGQLIDLNSKKIIGTKAAYNKQAAFGSDVISRIIFAQEADGLEKLHHVVIDEMNIMIQELVRENNIDLNNVTCCLCAGNTTMIHLLLKVDPTYIRREPYVPTANFVPVIRAAETGVKINPRGLLACVPGVSSYVGGDLTAGVLACGMDKTEKLSMLIDIGTNGEIALGNKDWLIVCAASAGPCFEGSGVSCGVRASKGAIQRIKINPDTFNVEYETILDAPAKGICGSGYIDAIAELLKARIIDRSGKINPALEHPRIRQGEYGREFVIALSEKTGTSADIVINEVDIENLKRAKGAIYAACSMLMRHMQLSFDDLEQVFIGGGFGTYLDMSNAIFVGLLPDLPREKFVFVGNSSLVGARQVLLSHDAIINAENIARKMTYFELSVEPRYMDEYVAALFFPHTDLSKFPSVQ